MTVSPAKKRNDRTPGRFLGVVMIASHTFVRRDSCNGWFYLGTEFALPSGPKQTTWMGVHLADVLERFNPEFYDELLQIRPGQTCEVELTGKVK